MVEDLVVLDSVTDINSVTSKKSAKIISLDYVTHSVLAEQNIPHKISDEYISEDERKEMFDYIVSCNQWYEKISGSKDLEFLDCLLLKK